MAELTRQHPATWVNQNSRHQRRQRIVRIAVIVISLGSTSMVNAEVPQACRDAFVENGAVPLAEDCRTLASGFPANMGNYYCGVEEIEEFCSTLPPYDPTDDGEDETSGADESGNPVSSTPGWFDAIFGPGLGLEFSLLSAGATTINLVSSAEQARETCDTGLLFSNIYALLLVFAAADHPINDTFQSFSDFTDTGIPGCQ